ncbi:MAG: glycerol-3-phosphate 1-O-acyltransferase PlsY [Planctomycetes bacterium]|nr:glycerol-3-phosphate 1-O-acyltransferase PlsY [Planctomycetota bacterium]
MAELIIVFGVYPVAGYLLGSIPFGLLIGRIHGVDVRKEGSGNIGSTNVGRILGRKWGILCFVFDVVKGLGPTLGMGFYLRGVEGAFEGGSLLPVGQWAVLAAGAGCILGHMFSVFLKFIGGKGVATSLGVVLGVWPYFTLAGVLAFLIWTAVWGMWRYVSLASIAAAVAFPVGFGLLILQLESWQFGQLIPLFGFSCVMGGLVIIRHRSNIGRLWAGTESRGGKGRSKEG